MSDVRAYPWASSERGALPSSGADSIGQSREPPGRFARPLPAEARLRRALKLASSTASALVVIIGGAGLLGWALDEPRLSSVIEGKVPIAPITSASLILLGAAAWAFAGWDEAPSRRRAAAGRALAVLGMVSAWAGVGRVDLVASAGTVLIALGLGSLEWTFWVGSRRYWPAHAFAFLASMVAIVGLLDFVLASPASYTHTALPTALGLFLLSGALVCARAEHGLGALLASATLGGALTRRIWPAALGVPMLLGAASWRVHSAGLLSDWGALSTMIVSMIALIGGLVVWNGYRIDRSDRLRRAAERALAVRERELREAHRLARVGSWFWDPTTNEVTWSPELYRIVGRDPSLPAPPLREHAALFVPESAARLKAAFDAAASTGAPFELDLTLAESDSALRFVIARGEVERDAGGAIRLMRGTVQDVTERELALLELARAHRAQQALSRCNKALVRATDEVSLLQQICEAVVDVAEYSFCWVGRVEAGEGRPIRVMARAGSGDGYPEGLDPSWADGIADPAPVSICIRRRERVVIDDISKHTESKRWRDAALARGYASSVAMPLAIEGEVFGVLEILAAEANAFGAKELELLEELADDLAFGVAALQTKAAHARAEAEVRLLNAELEQRVMARTAELRAANAAKDALLVEQRATSAELARAREREADVGFRIQQTLLLDSPPCDMPGLRVAAHTVPSQRVDGDFYAFISPRDQVLDVIVGDVMGKGILAALLGAATKSHFSRALADLAATAEKNSPPRPQDIVMLAHAGLARHLIELGSFVTLCYARIDLMGRRLDFVDCGHTGVLLIRQSAGGGAKLLHGDNLPLGIREGEMYRQVSVPLAPGDTLLMFSDGITDARDSSGQSFGLERLERLVEQHAALGPAELTDALARAVQDFSAGRRPGDDQTCVAIHIDGTALPLWHGEVEIRSDLKELVRARAFVRGFCRDLPGQPLDETEIAALELAVNEAASNVMKHAYACHGDQPIQIDADAYADRVSVRLRHVGSPFQPEAVQQPVFNGTRESGFGAFMIARSVDDVRYYRDATGRNCVALVKNRKQTHLESKPWT